MIKTSLKPEWQRNIKSFLMANIKIHSFKDINQKNILCRNLVFANMHQTYIADRDDEGCSI